MHFFAGVVAGFVAMLLFDLMTMVHELCIKDVTK